MRIRRMIEIHTKQEKNSTKFLLVEKPKANAAINRVGPTPSLGCRLNLTPVVPSCRCSKVVKMSHLQLQCEFNFKESLINCQPIALLKNDHCNKMVLLNLTIALRRSYMYLKQSKQRRILNSGRICLLIGSRRLNKGV